MINVKIYVKQAAKGRSLLQPGLQEDNAMKTGIRKRAGRLLCAMLALLCALSACSSPSAGQESENQSPSEEQTPANCLVVVEDEADTVDFQRTTTNYTVAQNVFDRLVEMENNADGEVEILPSLAQSWEISDDRRSYTFHLRPGVTFSNGSPLTASDVGYTLVRLLTHPESCNQDIAEGILGAVALERGEAETLEGFKPLNELDFVITLEEPFEAFLACLTMPGASILDQETTEAAGDDFGMDAEHTIGTGPFLLSEWTRGEGMTFVANQDCWSGAPACEGVELLFLKEAEAVKLMFDEGKLDILDLDDLSGAAEFYFHGDIYQDRLQQVQQIGTTYIALNENVEPLNDVRVRKALQMALDREVLLDAVYSGRGKVENGIFPHGLNGFNPDLPDIPYDPEQAKELLREAGYEDGFELTISMRNTSTPLYVTLSELAAGMWEKIGVKAQVSVLSESDFMKARKAGELACYAATWIADYNDPDNFIYTFFGSWDNTVFRSLCYPNEEVMERVRQARVIPDPEQRLKEYQELERIIVQEDAAWVPLFSRLRYYVTSQRLEGFRASWNGSVKNNYRHMSVKTEE